MRKLTYEYIDGVKTAVMVEMEREPLTEKQIERRNKRIAYFKKRAEERAKKED